MSEEKKKSRGWSITINNPTNEEEEKLKNDDYEFLIYQIEKGIEGTEHLQGFVYYKNPRIWPKKKYPRAHLEPAKSFEALKKYCSKDETRVRGPYEYGTQPNQGQRTDLEALSAEIIKGKRLEELAMEHPTYYVRYSKGLQALQNLVDKHREEKPTNIFLWGKAGVGKTKFVFDKHPREDIYVKDGTQWWDGYKGEKIILIDDFDGKWPFRDLLRLLDRYPYQGQIKGGYVKIAPTHIYITCEYHIRELYFLSTENELNQIYRRINHIYEIRSKEQTWLMPQEEIIEI